MDRRAPLSVEGWRDAILSYYSKRIGSRSAAPPIDGLRFFFVDAPDARVVQLDAISATDVAGTRAPSGESIGSAGGWAFSSVEEFPSGHERGNLSQIEAAKKAASANEAGAKDHFCTRSLFKGLLRV